MAADGLVPVSTMDWLVGVLAVGWLFSTPLSAGAEDAVFTVPVGIFVEEAQSPPAPWQVVQFETDIPKTRYRISRWENVMAIEATALASMALLAGPLNVDLTTTPVLCWR